MMAQHALKRELEKALRDKKTAHTVMVAHSQGCLLLRLVLEELVNADPAGKGTIRKAMLNRLCVFTFGNPSLDWKLEINSEDPITVPGDDQNSKDPKHLSSHVLRTEHFANISDFVATLGVLSEKDLEKRQESGYPSDCVFTNRENNWIGHLFGTQYSLDPSDYKDEKSQKQGQKSWLLACSGGVSMEKVKTSLSRPRL
jgi:hypothetical protein